jgi:hypothetical protein
MKLVNVQIELLSINELNEVAKQKAIDAHYEFMCSEPIECENENGEMVDEYLEPTEAEVIENIEANEYLFFTDGTLAHITNFCGNHPKSGTTEFYYMGNTYIL